MMGRKTIAYHLSVAAYGAQERSTKPTVRRSSRRGRVKNLLGVGGCSPPGASTQRGEAMAEGKRIATPVDWLFAPDWLTFEQACFLSGFDRDVMLEVLDEDGVDLNDEGLIARDSLREFQECLAMVLHWYD